MLNNLKGSENIHQEKNESTRPFIEILINPRILITLENAHNFLENRVQTSLAQKNVYTIHQKRLFYVSEFFWSVHEMEQYAHGKLKVEMKELL